MTWALTAIGTSTAIGVGTSFLEANATSNAAKKSAQVSRDSQEDALNKLRAQKTANEVAIKEALAVSDLLTVERLREEDRRIDEQLTAETSRLDNFQKAEEKRLTTALAAEKERLASSRKILDEILKGETPFTDKILGSINSLDDAIGALGAIQSELDITIPDALKKANALNLTNIENAIKSQQAAAGGFNSGQTARILAETLGPISIQQDAAAFGVGFDVARDERDTAIRLSQSKISSLLDQISSIRPLSLKEQELKNFAKSAAFATAEGSQIPNILASSQLPGIAGSSQIGNILGGRRDVDIRGQGGESRIDLLLKGISLNDQNAINQANIELGIGSTQAQSQFQQGQAKQGLFSNLNTTAQSSIGLFAQNQQNQNLISAIQGINPKSPGLMNLSAI